MDHLLSVCSIWNGTEDRICDRTSDAAAGPLDILNISRLQSASDGEVADGGGQGCREFLSVRRAAMLFFLEQHG